MTEEKPATPPLDSLTWTAAPVDAQAVTLARINAALHGLLDINPDAATAISLLREQLIQVTAKARTWQELATQKDIELCCLRAEPVEFVERLIYDTARRSGMAVMKASNGFFFVNDSEAARKQDQQLLDQVNKNLDLEMEVKRLTEALAAAVNTLVHPGGE